MVLSVSYFDDFNLCVYALQVRVCDPKGDGLSSYENLLANIFLRVSVWIVAILACFGNLTVLLSRFFEKETNKMHSLFIKNLAFADMLMGVYLLIIAIYDVKYRSNYIVHEHEWRHSWQCHLCGVISTLSSEVSVLILSVITCDRYVCIMCPLNLYKRSRKLAYTIAFSIWFISLFLAVVPVFGIPYFGNIYYNRNGACLPLHIHEPFGRGWEYSAFVYIGINSIVVLFIFYAYAAMFYVIKKSNISLRSSQVHQEASLARRFAFIVFSDTACWLPIILIKIVALAGVHVDKNVHAWVAVFVLPVNSALNPIIYTITTKQFQEHLILRVYYFCWNLLHRDSYDSRSSDMRTRRVTTPRLEIALESTRRKGLIIEQKPVQEPIIQKWSFSTGYVKCLHEINDSKHHRSSETSATKKPTKNISS
ncbi:relaxin receptor 1-like [Tubulanus polymorphus]|uniref:relaxin receptor 1-like n=1 Tax=Tubulanus polymorphus TaxID=672921 RepID=UPI003DA3FD2D